ncbi:hypothetical protein EV702DRAFT_1044822 [Suillus placidus]|uniref:Uncharacterized protein n=1 Tax=Suillus placidus TaxID=48579 RepID=A0A9P6ZG79_9AGAM|nr:hypothetical protein EV702DRAFT_1051319 [Suillus placidus]KAG1778137.1 hypothetical protein EV702DRAFT_1044822 [Suillus placidus]
MDDTGFVALSARLRRRIDNAFDRAAGNTSKSPNPPRKKRKLDSAQSSGFVAVEDVSPGGFLIEGAGGFLLDEYEDRTPSQSPGPISLSLSSIPAALQLLGLPSDDEEVLSVFRNAASGWGASLEGSNEVSQKDWRSVCAALLEGEDGEGNDDGGSSAAHSEMVARSDQEDDSGPDNDEYHMSVDEDTSELEASDEEYQDDKPAAVSRSHKSQKASRLLPTDAMLDASQLSAKQKAECREDFARFFPDVPDAELDRQKIMIKDVTRVADLLKEKIKAEEIIAMLEAFSTSPDKSMNLQDFERMMIATKLIRTLIESLVMPVASVCYIIVSRSTQNGKQSTNKNQKDVGGFDHSGTQATGYAGVVRKWG